MGRSRSSAVTSGVPRRRCSRSRFVFCLAAAGEQLGLSHYLVEPGKTLEKAIELANTIAKNARIPNYLIVQAIPRIEDMSASDGLWTESVAQAISMISDDARAGIDAFLGKRKIEF